MDCIYRYPCLTSFTAERSLFDDVNSTSALRALAACYNLEAVHLPPLTVDSIPIIKKLDSRSFERVWSLTLVAEEQCLEALSEFFNELQVLRLTVLGQSDTALRFCTNFDTITDLSVSFDDNDSAIIEGSDLSFLAERCSELSVLNISNTDLDWCPEAIGITDETIEDVAKAVPELFSISLFIDGMSLTERSLIALGTNCPKISAIDLQPTDICFANLCADVSKIVFPSLIALMLYQSIWQGSSEHIKDLADSFLSAAPQLSIFYCNASAEFGRAMKVSMNLRFGQLEPRDSCIPISGGSSARR